MIHQNGVQVQLLINLDAHCCRMGTAMKNPVPYRVKPSFVIFLTSGHSDAQG